DEHRQQGGPYGTGEHHTSDRQRTHDASPVERWKGIGLARRGRRSSPLLDDTERGGGAALLISLPDLLLLLLLLRRAHLRRAELDRQLRQLAGERERALVIPVVHRRARVATDVERLVPLRGGRQGMRDLLRIYLLAVHLQHPAAALAQSWPVVGEVE